MENYGVKSRLKLSSKNPNAPTKEPNEKDTPSIQIFVPGLFKDQAEESFNRDSKTRAAREVNNMETYQYGVNIPNIGKVSSVRNSNGDSIFTLTHDDGKVETIDKNDAINYMNYLLIQEDGIDQANQLFYNEDGNIRKDRPCLELSLGEKDKDHLIKFKNFMESKHSISRKESKLGNSFRISICDERLKNGLVKNGCFPDKSLSLKFVATNKANALNISIRLV